VSGLGSIEDEGFVFLDFVEFGGDISVVVGSEVFVAGVDFGLGGIKNGAVIVLYFGFDEFVAAIVVDEELPELGVAVVRFEAALAAPARGLTFLALASNAVARIL
jgi:hypothetical protein